MRNPLFMSVFRMSVRALRYRASVALVQSCPRSPRAPDHLSPHLRPRIHAMYLSIFTDELRQPDIAVSLDTIASWGVEWVCFRGSIFGKGIHDLDAGELQRLKAMLDERGLRTAALQSSLAKVHLPDAARRADEERKLEGLIRAAAVLDTRLVRSFHYWQPPAEQRGTLVESAELQQQVVDAFAPLAARAAQAGLILAFENCGVTCAEIHALLDIWDEPRWGLAWDPYNEWENASERKADEVGYMCRQAARSRMMHVKARGILAELGQQPLPWERILACAEASGLSGPVSIETHVLHGKCSFDPVDATQRSLEATRKAWPTDTPSDPREAATPRRTGHVERAWADDPVRMAVIGLGMGRNRARVIQQTAGCKLVGVCDLVADRAKTVGEEMGVPWSTDLRRFLDDPDVEAVVVMTETGKHWDIAEQALRAGKHVISTKPLEANLERCNRMIALADDLQRVLAVDFDKRNSPTRRALLAAVRAGWFGRVHMVHSHLKIWRDEAYFTKNGGWHGTWALDGGGTLSNQAVHHIDEIIDLFGMPARVRCVARTQTKPIEAEDIALATWEYANGMLVNFSSTTNWRPSKWFHSLEIAGEHGAFSASSGAPSGNGVRWWHDEAWSETPPVPADSEDRTWLNSFDNFAAHLRAGQPLACDARCGALSRQVLDACYASAAAEGGWVAIDAVGSVLPLAQGATAY